MSNDVKIVSPRYQQIAADVAAKIAGGHYSVGEKIYARSSLASQYGVSSETARRAICILSDMGIVSSTKGSGVVILSSEKAVKFVSQYTDIQTVNDLKKEILDSVERQEQENKHLKEQLYQLIDKTDRFKAINPFIPFEICIQHNAQYIGKTIAEINFWHNTMATIVAIKRGDSLLMSPGPYAILMEHDIFYFVGDENCLERVTGFLYS
ncbi:GntR family transcriptional regulator [Oscillospiraceae bacterium PP1C4]